MPPQINFQISSYQFVMGRGRVPEPQERIERLVRSGVNYARYRKLGTGGREPFQVVTIRDVEDVDSGYTLLRQYKTLVGAGLQTFIWEDQNYTAQGWSVVVLGVEQVSVAAVHQWSGAFDDADSKGKLTAEWTLEFRGV